MTVASGPCPRPGPPGRARRARPGRRGARPGVRPELAVRLADLLELAADEDRAVPLGLAVELLGLARGAHVLVEDVGLRPRGLRVAGRGIA